jgi:hypothetical protein
LFILSWSPLVSTKEDIFWSMFGLNIQRFQLEWVGEISSWKTKNTSAQNPLLWARKT